MTGKKQGFFIESLKVYGPGRPVAEIVFRDGLNVISGASDTGKSYVCELIDFAFGASDSPRDIERSKGYTSLTTKIRARESGAAFELDRMLKGGRVTLRELDADGRTATTRKVAWRHKAEDNNTLSAFLLGLSGFGPSKVRRNKTGGIRTLSFRDIAFLSVVNETRIFSTNPPHLSDNTILHTPQGDVFRLLVCGHDRAASAVVPKKLSAQGAKAQVELVKQLILEMESELAEMKLNSSDVKTELERVDGAREALRQSYESSRVSLLRLENERASKVRTLRESESRILVVRGLIARFELLNSHYDSDLLRLQAMIEAGAVLELFPVEPCQMCGAPPEAQRDNQAIEGFDLDRVRDAAEKEQVKLQGHKRDLQKTLAELAVELEERNREHESIQAEVIALQAQIEAEIKPRLRESSAQIQQQDAIRDKLLRAKALLEHLEQLRKRLGDLQTENARVKGEVGVGESQSKSGDMEEFSKHVEEILSAWHYPEMGHVEFSEREQDLEINGEARASHGKGVRALTCAAFLAGLLRHCLTSSEKRPHPGLLILDSPLVAYREKDPDVSAERAKFEAAGVKQAFYKALAEGICPGQVIILENADPQADLGPSIVHHHFSGTRSSRYGFFPM